MRKSETCLLNFKTKTHKKKEKEKNSRNESSMAFKKHKKAQSFLHLSKTIICFTTDLYWSRYTNRNLVAKQPSNITLSCINDKGDH